MRAYVPFATFGTHSNPLAHVVGAAPPPALEALLDTDELEPDALDPDVLVEVELPPPAPLL